MISPPGPRVIRTRSSCDTRLQATSGTRVDQNLFIPSLVKQVTKICWGIPDDAGVPTADVRLAQVRVAVVCE